MKRIFAFIIMGWVCAISAHAAQNMMGRASVNVTSDTAAAAKNMALVEARRQIIRDVMGQYSDIGQLDMLLANAPDADLTPLIAKSRIGNEQTSATTYSADIQMTLDRDAVRNWLNENGVQNWLGDPATADQTVVFVRLGGLNDWIELNAIARDAGFALNTRHLDAARVIMEIPAANRAMFTAAARGAGWRYSDDNGILNLWK